MRRASTATTCFHHQLLVEGTPGDWVLTSMSTRAEHYRLRWLRLLSAVGEFVFRESACSRTNLFKYTAPKTKPITVLVNWNRSRVKPFICAAIHMMSGHSSSTGVTDILKVFRFITDLARRSLSPQARYPVLGNSAISPTTPVFLVVGEIACLGQLNAAPFGLVRASTQAFVPPSTVKFAPVMYEDSGLATKATNAATSSTVPYRLSEVMAF
jgi:hypothetical protein